MESCEDQEILEVLGKITNITFVDAQVDFNISLGFNTRACRVYEDNKEKCVYEIQNKKLYISQEERKDPLDKVQDIEDPYNQLYKEQELEWKEKQELEWEQEEEILMDEIRYNEYVREQKEYEDSEYTTEKVIDEGKVGHWSDDDEDD